MKFINLVAGLSVLFLPYLAISASKSDSTTVSAVVQNTFSANDSRPASVTISKNGKNYVFTVAGGGTCPSGQAVLNSQGCLSILTNSRGTFSVPLTYAPLNSLTYVKNSGNGIETDQIGDQVSRVVVSLTPLNGGSVSGTATLTANSTTGTINVTLPQVVGLTTLNYAISYRFEANPSNAKKSPQAGLYTGVWPISLGTVTIAP